MNQMKTTRFCSAVMALAAAVFCSRASATDFQLPASYNDFKLSTAYSSLNEAIKAESFIIIPPGEYEIENPIVIDQDRPLYLLGVARQRVHLVPKHVKEPMLKSSFLSFSFAFT